MRGRKPKPSVLRMVQNNPGKRPVNHDEPIPPALESSCPQELIDPIARREWDRAIVPAVERGQVTSADRTLAIAHCELWATWQSQLLDASRHAHVIAAGPSNYPTPNPARIMANKTLQLLTKVDAELGFTPTSRTRVHVPGRIADDSPLSRFLRRR
jgi:P27 family predicted phage terminase small subunit